MIIDFSIRNFKSIKDEITLSMEASSSSELENLYVINLKSGKKRLRLLKLALIYGQNASGKSTILEALSFLANVMTDTVNDKTKTFKDLMPFLGSKTSKGDSTSFKLNFYANDVLYYYEVELNKYCILQEKLYRKTPKKALIFKRVTDVEKQVVNVEFGSTVDLKKDSKTSLINNTLWNNSVIGGYLKSNIFNDDLRNVSDWSKKGISMLHPDLLDISLSMVPTLIKENDLDMEYIAEVMKAADLFINKLRIEEKKHNLQELDEKSRNFVTSFLKLLYDKDVDLKKPFVKEDIVLTHFGEKEFDLNILDESRGTRKFLSLISILLSSVKKGSIVLIDELEASLHPKLIEYIVEFFLENLKNVQLIATTHYAYLLKNKNIIRKDAVWFTEKKSDGSTDLYSLDDFKSSDLRKEHNLYNSYLAGKFGALPNLMPSPPLPDIGE